MSREVKDRWEFTADGFQETADVAVGINWGWDGLDDVDLLGEVAGRDVIELGCGGGQCTVALADRGANVVGVDLTAAQLAHATDLFAQHDVDPPVVLGDVTDLPFRADRFDVAFNSYVFQWVEDLQACFTETRRVLRPGGRFVFSMPHPFFDLADPDTHEIVESYFETGRQVTVDGREEYPDLVTYRQTLSDVYNELVQAGFVVERLREPGSSDPADYEAGPWGNSPPELQAKLPTVLVVEATTED